MLDGVWLVRRARIGFEVVAATAILFVLAIVARPLLWTVGDSQEMVVVLAVLCSLQAL